MKLHIKSPGGRPGVYHVAERGKALKHLSFTVIQLGGTLKEHSLESGEEELSIDSYSGPVRVDVEGGTGRWSAEIGGRASLASASPMIYVPAGSKVKVRTLNGDVRLSIAGAPGKSGGAPVLIEGDQIMRNQVGKDNWSRLVLTHIANNVDAAHLICGETISAGGWSSFPPHKHDRFALPAECPMEEVYYFLLEPPQGFAFIRLYTDSDDPEPFDYAFPVEHGDTVLIPRGYHPVTTSPGYTLNYTWALAGEGRTYGAWWEDPRHAWIKNS